MCHECRRIEGFQNGYYLLIDTTCMPIKCNDICRELIVYQSQFSLFSLFEGNVKYRNEESSVKLSSVNLAILVRR